MPLPDERIQANKDTVEEIDREADRVTKKHGYQPGQSWSKLTLEAMALKVGLGDTYNFAYRTLSNIDHPSGRGLIAYQVQTPKGLRLDIGPSDSYVYEVLATAYIVMIDIVSILNNVLELGLVHSLEEAKIKTPPPK